MCVQYRGGISWVPWGDILSTVGVFSTVGDIMINVGDFLSTVGVFSTVGGYHEYHGGLSWVPWGMFSTVGDIMMHVEGYHEYRGGCSVPWGEKSFVIWVPHGTEHPHGTHDIPPHASWYPPRYSNFKGWYPPTVLNIPHGTQDNPHGTQDNPPHLSWYPPMVLNTPNSTQDIPHIYHDIPPRYWTPPTVLKISVLKISPHGTHDIPHGTEHPHGTAHTLYRVNLLVWDGPHDWGFLDWIIISY